MLRNDNSIVFESKRSYLVGIVSVMLSVISLIFVNWLILKFYHVDFKQLLNNYKPLFMPQLWPGLQPEPQERLQYLTTAIVMPFALLIFYSGSKKVLAGYRHNINYLYLLSVSIGLSLLFLMIFFDLKHDPINFLLYTEESAAYTHLRQQILPQLISDFSLIFLNLPIFIWLTLVDYKSKIGKIINGFFVLSLLFMLIVIFLINIFGENAYQGWMGHFNAVYYSVAQVVNGNSVLVDFTSQYGLFPHFVAPIFQLFGFNVLKYSIVMSLLVCLSFLGILIFLRNSIQNPFILWLGFVAVITFNYFLIRLYVSWDVYFQYWPIRFLFPCLALLIASLYLKWRNNFWYFVSLILFPVGILWNLDSGLVVYIAWVMLLCYDELFQNYRDVMFKRMLRHILMSLIGLILVVAVFSLFIHLRSGNYPDWQTFFKYQSTFYISGFAMMYMPLFHPWNIIILTYVIGLFVSIRAVIEGESTYQARMIFLLSILGVGIFSYYQGRSHDYVLPSVAYPATLLWVIFADRLLLKWKAKQLLFPGKVYFLLIMSLFILGMSVILFSGKSILILKQAQRGYSSFNTNEPIAALKINIDFIKENTLFGEKVFIICEPHLDGIYYGDTGTRSAVKIPGSSELLLVEDFEKEIQFISKQNDYKLFVDFAYVPQEMILILKENYEIIGKSQSGMQYLHWNAGIAK